MFYYDPMKKIQFHFRFTGLKSRKSKKPEKTRTDVLPLAASYSTINYAESIYLHPSWFGRLSSSTP